MTLNNAIIGHDLAKDINCYSNTVSNYVKLLKSIYPKQKSILTISKETGLSDDNTQRMVKKLQNKGYVKKIFSGKERYIALTEKGKQTVIGIIDLL